MDPGGKTDHRAGSSQPEKPVDPRHYIFSFPISSLADIPVGFPELPGCGKIESGVFLPQDDADWLGRRRYPARILLVTETEVIVSAHQAAGGSIWRAPIRGVQSLEWGRVLLLGWVVFTGMGGTKRLPFNTRGILPVGKCVTAFKERWLAEKRPGGGRLQAFGAPLTLKFEYARKGELLEAEAPVAQFFHPPVRWEKRMLFFRRRVWSPGDLAVATGQRVFWITDCYRRRHEPYGTVTLSAPLSAVREAALRGAGASVAIDVAFHSGGRWSIPAGEGMEEEAEKFVEVLGRLI